MSYRRPQEHNRTCPLWRRCADCANGRTIKRDEHEHPILARRAKMDTRGGKAISQRRGRTVEPWFADAKTHRGSRRFSGRGSRRARIEAGLLVLSHDLLVVNRASQPKATGDQDGTPCQDAA
jgi:hypothetical protein